MTTLLLLCSVALIALSFFGTQYTGFLSFPIRTGASSCPRSKSTTTCHIPDSISSSIIIIITSIKSHFIRKKEARETGNDRKNKTERVKKVKDDVIEIEGVVLESLPTPCSDVSLTVPPIHKHPSWPPLVARFEKLCQDSGGRQGDH
ncbi:hypothetical protein MHU86_25752 [Fragilaria crotonensis]|nr:hypothetical protein MHU86_25752 [Fragilaria crotonensis]